MHTTREDAWIDAALAEAKPVTPEPSLGLLNRVLADAAAVTAGSNATALAEPAPPRLAGWRGLFAGWHLPIPGIGLRAAALGGCGAIGLWLGMAVSPGLFADTSAAAIAVGSPADAVSAFYDLAQDAS